jgi:hypothetical protein
LAVRPAGARDAGALRGWLAGADALGDGAALCDEAAGAEERGLDEGAEYRRDGEGAE